MTPYFIEKHPTPWKITTTSDPQYPDLDAHEEIQDANGSTIIAAYDAESYWAGFKGAGHLVAFINNHFGGRK